MNTIKKLRSGFGSLLLTVAMLAMLALPARAQVGFDLWGPNRIIALTNQITAVTANGSTTNNPVLTRMFDGTSVVFYWFGTNFGSNTFQVLPQTSADTTNWNSLSNYAIGYWTTVTNTNSYNGTVISTNQYLLPGTPTSVTASSSGFSTPYLSYSPFTNSGVYSNNANAQIAIAYTVADQGAYFRTIYTTTGTNTYGGFWIGRVKGN
jgi:hypothetical protein